MKVVRTVIARNEARQSCAQGVMLRYSDDSALLHAQTVTASNEHRQCCVEGVMLRYSKHGRHGLSAHILREPLDDSALLYAQIYTLTVIARNEAISEQYQSGSRINIRRDFRLLLSVLFCLFLSASAFAQGRDSSHSDTSKTIITLDAPRPLRKSAQPLMIVNGKIYKRRLKSIDPKTIVNVTVLKSRDAETLYGPKAKNGAVIITTKK